MIATKGGLVGLVGLVGRVGAAIAYFESIYSSIFNAFLRMAPTYKTYFTYETPRTGQAASFLTSNGFTDREEEKSRGWRSPLPTKQPALKYKEFRGICNKNIFCTNQQTTNEHRKTNEKENKTAARSPDAAGMAR